MKTFRFYLGATLNFDVKATTEGEARALANAAAETLCQAQSPAFEQSTITVDDRPRSSGDIELHNAAVWVTSDHARFLDSWDEEEEPSAEVQAMIAKNEANN